MRFRYASAAALLAAVPGISMALGLGDETVRSWLNAPLNAEIELFATPDELATVQVQLAGRDDFIRHGLDYPGFLTGIQVRTERLADGRNIIRLSSTQPMVEPFVVLLVDVRSSGSRLLREYTLLLDPPAFQTQQAPVAPVAAPSAGESPQTTIPPAQQPAPQARQPAPATPAPAPAPAPAARAPTPPQPAAPTTPGQYTVQRGDTLSRIAGRQYGSDDLARGMIAIYRANPQAFGGNINLLQAGASLQIPDALSMTALTQAEAVADVRSQMAAWRNAEAVAPQQPAEARLRLVPPGGPAGTGAAEEGAEGQGGGAAAPATADRALAVESADLARLQGPSDQAPAGADAGSDASLEQAGDIDAADLGIADATSVESAEEITPPAPAPAPAAAPPAEEPSPGLLARLAGYWQLALGGLAIIVALLALVAVRRRREAAAAYAPLSPSLDELTLPGQRDSSSDTFPLRKPADSRDSNIVVEESDGHDRIGSMRRDTHTVDLEEGASSATMGTAALEQGDPLAEADFHMAYGLYDQAADLVKAALDREPQRRDLKLKLLEVFFVWGNKDQFLQTARDLGRTRDVAPPGEWEKVVIMGKQLAPEDVLFHQSAGVAAQTSVDLNLEGGQNLVDFDLPGPDAADGVDVNLGATDMVQALDGDGGLDFMFDEPLPLGEDGAPTGTTRQMVQPGLDEAINAPTVEQPALDIEDTLAGKVDALGAFSGSPDQTAELALDDLGLDLGKLEVTGTGMSPPELEPEDLNAAGDAPTLVAGLDETSRELLANAGADASERTEMLPLTDLDLGGLDTDLDMDFSTAETGKSPALDAAGDLDLDVGSADLDVGPVDSLPGDADDWQSTQRIDPALLDDTMIDGDVQKELEPVTMSEVGTKLDLARAYMDMGDPDGARSILGEVLQEGSESQRTEAQRLLDSIPG